jgi:hypothetical protein
MVNQKNVQQRWRHDGLLMPSEYAQPAFLVNSLAGNACT